MKKSLEKLNAGQYQDGSDEAESDSYSKIIALVALYAGDANLDKMIEQVVRTTLNNDRSVSILLSPKCFF